MSLARRERRWTLAELAERVGVSVVTIRKVERGDPTVALGTAFEAAVIAGVVLFQRLVPSSYRRLLQMRDRRTPRTIGLYLGYPCRLLRVCSISMVFSSCTSVRSTARSAGLVVSTAVAMVLVVATALTVPADTAAAGDRWSDIDDRDVHADALNQLDEWGILNGTGCEGGRFCPDEPVQRWMMAVWLVRLIDNVHAPPAAADGSAFTDVHTDDGRPMWWTAHVYRLQALGVTKGCSPTRFCPYEPVTRAQMATFLTRAFHLAPAANAFSTGFGDVAGSVHEAGVDALARAEITRGCSTDPPGFCPRAHTTKAQMAAFLVRAVRNAPLPVITPSSQQTASGSVEVVVDFGRPVTGFTEDDLWVVNGEASDPVPDGDAYRVTISPRHYIGTTVVRAREAAAHDAAGRASRASTPFAVVFACAPPDCEELAWNPYTGIDTWDRAAVVRAYQEEYGDEDPEASWTGSTETCDPGSTSEAYRNSVIRRLNYYRAMAGVQDVTEDTQQSISSQLKALILAAEEEFTHYLDSEWRCYDQQADDFGSEVLHAGYATRYAIDSFIRDRGDHNREVGHRRILLDRDAIGFGIGHAGSVTAMQEPGGTWSNPMRNARTLGFTAWPPPGYVPSNVVFPRWNFDEWWMATEMTALEVLDDRGEQIFTAEFDSGQSGLAWNMQDPQDNLPETRPLNLKRPIDYPLYRDACYTVVATLFPADGTGGADDVLGYVTCLVPRL